MKYQKIIKIVALCAGIVYAAYDFMHVQHVEEATITNIQEDIAVGKDLHQYPYYIITTSQHDSCFSISANNLEQKIGRSLKTGETLQDVQYHQNHLLSPLGLVHKMATTNNCDSLHDFKVQQ